MTAQLISARLRELGFNLPASNAPRGSYVPFLAAGDLLFVAGQAPRLDGILKFTGRVGIDLTVAQGQEAARICALNILGHLAEAIDDEIGKVASVVRLAGVVNCSEDFQDIRKSSMELRTC